MSIALATMLVVTPVAFDNNSVLEADKTQVTSAEEVGKEVALSPLELPEVAFGHTSESTSAEESDGTSSPLTGFVGLQSAYLDDNTLSYTPDQLVIQAGLTYEVAEGFSLDAWGIHGTNNDDGAELDIGAFYSTEIAEDTEVTISGYRFVLSNSPDITAISTGLTHGPIDITLTYYNWSLKDVVRFVGGYTIEPTEKVSARALVTYESSGFDARPVSVGGDVTYALSDTFSLNAGVRSDFHKVRGVFGITASF